MEFPVGKIVVVDEEVLAGGNAEGKRSACTDVILALGDCGENFGPSGLVGTKAWLQVISSTNRFTIVYRRVIRQLQEAEPRPKLPTQQPHSLWLGLPLLLESRAQGPLC
jgi:hypothetical protein